MHVSVSSNPNSKYPHFVRCSTEEAYLISNIVSVVSSVSLFVKPPNSFLSEEEFNILESTGLFEIEEEIGEEIE